MNDEFKDSRSIPNQQVALSSITWPSPGMAAIPPNELPLPLPAQNSLTFHSSPGDCNKLLEKPKQCRQVLEFVLS